MKTDAIYEVGRKESEPTDNKANGQQIGRDGLR